MDVQISAVARSRSRMRRTIGGHFSVRRNRGQRRRSSSVHSRSDLRFILAVLIALFGPACGGNESPINPSRATATSSGQNPPEVGFAPGLGASSSTCGGESAAGNPFPCCDNGGNCTWWAWKTASENWGAPLSGSIRGHARLWGDQARSAGYSVGQYPAVGTLAVRTQGTFGHVAWVTQVDCAGRRVTVSEMNCCLADNQWCGTNSRESASQPSIAGPRTHTYSSSFFSEYIYREGTTAPQSDPCLTTQQPSPTFTISLAPAVRTVSRGGTATYTVSIQGTAGFTGAVGLFALDLPGNQVLPGTGFSPQTVNPGSGTASSTLTIATDAATPTGTFTITVEGRSGGVTRSTTITLSVETAIGSSEFSVQATPSARTVARGGTVTYAISVQGTAGFGGAVGLFAINLPANQVLPGTGFSPQTVSPGGGTASSTLTIVTDAATPIGTFTITVEGRSGGVTRSTTITLTVS
jgi:surface antigen